MSCIFRRKQVQQYLRDIENDGAMGQADQRLDCHWQYDRDG